MNELRARLGAAWAWVTSHASWALAAFVTVLVILGGSLVGALGSIWKERPRATRPRANHSPGDVAVATVRHELEAQSTALETDRAQAREATAKADAAALVAEWKKLRGIK